MLRFTTMPTAPPADQALSWALWSGSGNAHPPRNRKTDAGIPELEWADADGVWKTSTVANASAAADGRITGHPPGRRLTARLPSPRYTGPLRGFSQSARQNRSISSSVL